MRNGNLSQISIKAESGLSFISEVWFRSPTLGFILSRRYYETNKKESH